MSLGSSFGRQAELAWSKGEGPAEEGKREEDDADQLASAGSRGEEELG